jgi:uncharacterized protein YigA (DUF484 family)
MSTRQQDIPQDAVQEHDIADYLRTHPDFFLNHTGLLADIQIPHHTAGAISLIERQVTVLRQQNQDLKRQLHALVQVARDNDRLNEQVQRLTLALMEAGDLAATLRIVGDSLRNDFRADAAVLGLFAAGGQLSAFDDEDLPRVRALSEKDPEAGAFATVLATGKPLCGHLRRAQMHYLFGEIAAENVASAVVLTLNAAGTDARPSRRLGLLGIGSRDARRYHAGMGTLFLTHLGELIGRAVGRYLPLH